MPKRTPLPARYPPVGVWPAIMRSDMAAAYLDYRDTVELARAVARGEAPRPTGYHGLGRTREPIWSKAAIDEFTGVINMMGGDNSATEDLARLT